MDIQTLRNGRKLTNVLIMNTKPKCDGLNCGKNSPDKNKVECWCEFYSYVSQDQFDHEENLRKKEKDKC